MQTSWHITRPKYYKCHLQGSHERNIESQTDHTANQPLDICIGGSLFLKYSDSYPLFLSTLGTVIPQVVHQMLVQLPVLVTEL